MLEGYLSRSPPISPKCEAKKKLPSNREPQTERSAPSTDQFLRGRISKLRKLEQECFASRTRFGFYQYLASVYQLYADLRKINASHDAARRIAKLFNLDIHQDAHLIRVILDANSQADSKAKSRWPRALRFARHERESWTDLESFLRENGGPAGCASQHGALHPRPPRGCVRVGGEGRVPKISLFMSRDILH